MKVYTDSEDTWDAYFMKMACLVASKSKDRSMKVGCVLVGEGNCMLSTGYNGFPRGVDDDNEEYNKRPAKYIWTSHDAANAVYNAARNGIKLLDSRAYVNAHPCHECARALVQAGVIEVITPTQANDAYTGAGRWEEWAESINNAKEIFKAGKVMVTEYGI